MFRCLNALISVTFLFSYFSGIAVGEDSKKQIELCADFSQFPDNHVFPGTFDQSGYNFKTLATGDLIVNVTGNERGLFFKEDGIHITLPAEVSAVRVRLGTFASDVTVSLHDANGDTIHKEDIQATNEWKSYEFKPESGTFSSIKFFDGGHEGGIAHICCDLIVVQGGTVSATTSQLGDKNAKDKKPKLDELERMLTRYRNAGTRLAELQREHKSLQGDLLRLKTQIEMEISNTDAKVIRVYDVGTVQGKNGDTIKIRHMTYQFHGFTSLIGWQTVPDGVDDDFPCSKFCEAPENNPPGCTCEAHGKSMRDGGCVIHIRCKPIVITPNE